MKSLLLAALFILAVVIGGWFCIKTYMLLHSVATVGIFLSALIIGGSQYV